MKPPRNEDDIEKYLVKCVRAAGGEIRKVKWIGRVGAPDRRVMLPWRKLSPNLLPRSAFWVEVKPPGGLTTFPADARERRQEREHDRMRACGEQVVIVDSYEGVEALLR
jgi:hypothetical protein